MGGLPWGGSEELWSQAALHLNVTGNHHVVASVVKWGDQPTKLAELETAGIELLRRPKEPGLLDRISKRFGRKRFPGFPGLASIAWLKKSAPDLVLISQGGPWDGIGWMLACLRLGIRYCAVIHAHSELWWPQDRHLPDIRRALSGATHLFFVSRANRSVMRNQTGLELANTSIVFNPLKVGFSEPVLWPQATGKIQLACVGRLDAAAKGQDILLNVMAKPKWRNRPIQLNLYGNGSSADSLAALASTLKLTNVAFCGHVSNVSAIWAGNQALVLPSRFEGLPLAILEAMLAGRPVITTDIAGNAEYLTEGKTGFIAAAPAVQLFDEAMERAWSVRKQWRDIGLEARRQAIRCLPPDPVGLFAGRLLRFASVTLRSQRRAERRPVW